MTEHPIFRFGCLGAFLALLVHALYQRSLPEESQNGGVIVIEFITMAVIVGVLLATWAIPALGDKVSEAMIGSGAQAEEAEASSAAALAAAGDWHGAISEYQKMALAQPDARFPVAEIARLYHDKLGDADGAIQTLRTALVSRTWAAADETFLRVRLADLLVSARKDFDAARAELDEITSKYPNTPHAGQAHHKRHEVDEAEFLAKRAG